MSATMQDVARLAGVSTATVSHVINNTRRVTPHTRQLVLDAIQKLHYQPSALARSLKTEITKLVGVVVADITNPFFAEIVRGVENRLAVHEYSLILCNTDERADREARSLSFLRSKLADGVIIAPTGHDQADLVQMAAAGTPLVFIDRYPTAALGPTITIDNFEAAYAATEHLIALGHTRIGLLTRHPNLSTVLGRTEGYRSALEDHGIPLQDNYCQIAGYHLDDAITSARQLLTMPDRPTAIITGNYVMTQGLLHAVKDVQLNCPQDISIVCFDDSPWISLFTPPLTTVRVDTAGICDAAVSTLTEMIQRKERQPRDEGVVTFGDLPDIVIQAELIVRESTAPLP